MNAALIGLPYTGKSTLFSALTCRPVDPFAPPEPRHAVIHVPDERLSRLAAIFHPKKIVEATIDFVDVPGCKLDDAKGQQEWRRLLPHARQADLLVVVLRMFESSSAPPSLGRIDPHAEFQAMWDEFLFADLDAVTTRVDRLHAAMKKPTRTHEQEKRELALLERCRTALESNQPLSSVGHSEEERKQLASFAFLTEKPVLCVLNVSDDQAGQTFDFSFPHVHSMVSMSCSIEAELARLDPRDRQAFLADLGLSKTVRDEFIRACHDAAGYLTFLTGSAEDVHAWALRKGGTALDAATRIHTEIAQGFIRAETIAFDELMACGDLKNARAAGKVRKEGKTYTVHDGDYIVILTSG